MNLVAPTGAMTMVGVLTFDYGGDWGEYDMTGIGEAKTQDTSGKKRNLKNTWTFLYRTIQFFIKGITI